MGRDDEIIVAQCYDGSWTVAHVFAGNISKVDFSTGNYDNKSDAVIVAHEFNACLGGTEYGVSIYRPPRTSTESK